MPAQRMEILSTRLPDISRRNLVRLSILTNLALFAVSNILIAALSPGDVLAQPNSPIFQLERKLIWTCSGSALFAALIAPILLNSVERIQQRLARQNTELRSLHAIDTAISAELKLEPILQAAVKHATLALDGDFAGLWLFDTAESASRVTASAYYNVVPSLQATLQEIAIGHGVASARQADAPIRWRDPAGIWADDPLAKAVRLRGAITAPIKRGDVLLGLLFVGLGGSTPLAGRTFRVDDEDMLGAVATTVGVAVQNARLYQETERRGEMLRSLVARTGDAIAASSDASLLMQILADEAAGILRCARVGVYELDDALEQYVPLAAAVSDVNDVTTLDQFYRQPLPADLRLPDSPPPGADPNENVYQDIRSLLELDPDTGQFLTGSGYFFVLRSRENRCIGLIALLDCATLPNESEAGAFAIALAAQAAVALENARLSERTLQLLAQSRALQASTNQIASELDPSRVLAGLMDTARQVLVADGYALWWREDEVWERRAAHGLGFELPPGSRDPREITVLQRVFVERSAAVIPNTLQSDLTASLGTGTGMPTGGKTLVRAILALPMQYAGKIMGVMVLYYRRPHSFADEEVNFAQSFAHQAANALENARLFTSLSALYAREKRIAEQLQTSLLPPIPDRIMSFEFAHKYKAGLEEAAVGGDYLDLFMLSRTHVGVVIADVSGKGLDAAVQTAMVKYTLRGFAEETPTDPSLVLERLNNVLCSEVSNLQGFVTLFYGVLDLEASRLRYSNAGHELPVFCRQGTDAKLLPLQDGMALGCFPRQCYENEEITFGQDDYLLLYTDGLTEARNSDMQILGSEGLEKYVACADMTAKQAIEVIYERILDFAEGKRRDDIAMLLLRRAG
jgi:serine phosphatase RsbU (regulator of sigma subunit)